MSPKCIISYSWESEEHKNWVRNLAEKLHENGVYVHLDQWDLKPGMNLPGYMEKCVRECDFVLLIATPSFSKKANLGEGGVGYEKNIVTGEIFNGEASNTKFVPVIRKGTPQESLPSRIIN